MTGQKLAVEIGRSQNYVAERLRDEKSFTLDDVDAICSYYELDPGEFIERAYDLHADRVLASMPTDNVVQLGDRKSSDDAVSVEDLSERSVAKKRRNRVEGESEGPSA